MTQTPAKASPIPQEIPDSFFADMGVETALPGPSAARDLMQNFGTPLKPGSTLWQPNKILPWYDAIIDDMFANPGCTMRETAARLGRNQVTIGLIIRSDLFKARYAQRRIAFNEEIQHRLTGKLVRVAEAALDHTLTTLDKKKDQVPLPLLNEITNRALDRLGYAPQQAANPTVAVQVNNTVGGAQVSVSAEDLAAARDKLRIVESRNAVRQPSEGSQDSLSAPSGGEGTLIEGSDVGAL